MFEKIKKLSISVAAMSLSFGAWAQSAPTPTAAPSPTSSFLVNLPIFLALFGLFYFGVIRPQNQRQKQQNNFQTNLKRGEEVTTAAGIIGTVAGISDRVVTLEVANGTEIKVLRSQVQGYFKDAVQDGAPAQK